jgi:predicted alpha/beta hydrolase family esterase
MTICAINDVRGTRLLIVPGLHDSGPTHWQSWLQALHRGALRVQQRDWNDPLRASLWRSAARSSRATPTRG